MARWKMAEALGTAAVTMTVTLGLLWPVAGGATAPKKENQPEIVWPTAKAKGWNVTLRAKKSTYEAGETPEIELVAVRTEEKAEDCKIEIRMLAQSPESMYSRRMVMPTEMWKYGCTLIAADGKLQTRSIASDAKITKEMSVYFTMRAGASMVGTRPVTNPTTAVAALQAPKVQTRLAPVSVAAK